MTMGGLRVPGIEDPEEFNQTIASMKVIRGHFHLSNPVLRELLPRALPVIPALLGHGQILGRIYTYIKRSFLFGYFLKMPRTGFVHILNVKEKRCLTTGITLLVVRF